MPKNVEFLHLTVEGFRSYQKPTAFPLTGKGLVLIKGPNGAGKTTIFSALTWALYKLNLNGTNNDKVATWDRYRLPEWRGTRVTVTFQVNGVYYMVARHLNFKGNTKALKGGDKLMIFRRAGDDAFEQTDLVGEAQHKKDQQGYINDLIGVEPRTFLNSILFGQRMARLVSSDDAEKRKLFDTLFELDFIEPAKKKAQMRKLELEQRHFQLNEEVKGKSALITNLKLNLSEQRNLVASFNTQKATRVATASNKVLELEKQYDNVKRNLGTLRIRLKNTAGADELETLRTKYEESRQSLEAGELLISNKRTEKRNLHDLIAYAEGDIRRAESKKAKHEKELECVAEDCPACQRPLKKADVDDVKKNIKLLIQEQKDTLATLKKSLKVHEQNFKHISERLEQMSVELGELREDNAHKLKAYNEKKALLKELEQTKKDIGTAEALIGSYAKQIKSAQDELSIEEKAKPPKIDTKSTENKIAFLEGELEVICKQTTECAEELSKVLWWINKAFGAGGLKSHVFSAMLGQLNEHIDRYAQRMGLRCRFSVDLSKASKPFITKCYINDFEVDYQDLSGGQKQKLDCVVAFAMHDLVNSISTINFLILDEVFEGLDPDNIETIFDLIRVKTEAGKLVFVITHSQSIDSLLSKSIYIDVDAGNMVSTIT